MLAAPIPDPPPPSFSTIDRVSLDIPRLPSPDTPVLRGFAGPEDRLTVRLTDHFADQTTNSWKFAQFIGAVSAFGSAAVRTLEIRLETLQLTACPDVNVVACWSRSVRRVASRLSISPTGSWLTESYLPLPRSCHLRTSRSCSPWSPMSRLRPLRPSLNQARSSPIARGRDGKRK